MFKNLRKILNSRKNLGILVDLLGAIAIWRGIWGILDLIVFPGNKLFSYLVSIILGIILVLLDGKI